MRIAAAGAAARFTGDPRVPPSSADGRRLRAAPAHVGRGGGQSPSLSCPRLPGACFRRHGAADLTRNPHAVADEFNLLQLLKPAGVHEAFVAQALNKLSRRAAT
jgi:hypothetical protein